MLGSNVLGTSSLGTSLLGDRGDAALVSCAGISGALSGVAAGGQRVEHKCCHACTAAHCQRGPADAYTAMLCFMCTYCVP